MTNMTSWSQLHASQLFPSIHITSSIKKQMQLFCYVFLYETGKKVRLALYHTISQIHKFVLRNLASSFTTVITPDFTSARIYVRFVVPYILLVLHVARTVQYEAASRRRR